MIAAYLEKAMADDDSRIFLMALGNVACAKRINDIAGIIETKIGFFYDLSGIIQCDFLLLPEYSLITTGLCL